jgi:hypothetical protein
MDLALHQIRKLDLAAYGLIYAWYSAVSMKRNYCLIFKTTVFKNNLTRNRRGCKMEVCQ